MSGLGRSFVKNSREVRVLRRKRTIKRQLAYKKGIRAEEIFLEASRLLVEEGFIQRVYLAERGSMSDREGIDAFIVVSKDNPPGSKERVIGVQIKSSKENAFRFLKRHKGIPVVVVNNKNDQNTPLVNIVKKQIMIIICKRAPIPELVESLFNCYVPATAGTKA